MNFDIPEELKMVQTLVRDFVRDQLRPLEREIMGRAAGLADARACLPPEDELRLQALAEELGLWGPGVPERLGGMGLGALGQCLAEEEMAQTIIPFSFGDVTPLLFECSAGQRQRYFEPHFRRRRQALIALLEPQDAAASGPAAAPGATAAAGFPSLQTTAVRDGAAWVLNGTKLSFSRPGGDFFAIVFASATPGATAFLVDGGTPGLTVTGGREAAGWRTQVRDPVALAFAGCHVPEENMLGAPGQAFRLARQWLPGRRLVRGARCVGVGQRLLEEARSHVESWQSFGQQLYRRPGVESALADIAISLHACRLLVYEAACNADAAMAAAGAATAGGTEATAGAAENASAQRATSAQRVTSGAPVTAGAPATAGVSLPGGAIKRDAAMVKIFATQTIRTVADRVSHLFNGPPYIQGLPMQRLCADALASNAVDLALELQCSIIAADVMKGLKV